MDSGAPFAALLVGQPTLRQRLRLGVLAALDQRVSVRYALAGMNAKETEAYVAHHVKIAGRSDTLFSADAITLIHNASRGYPRAVNNLAVNALTAAFARDSATMSGLYSTPTAVAPRLAAVITVRPSPDPRSITKSCGVTFAMSSILSTSACGDGTQTTSLPGCPTSG